MNPLALLDSLLADWASPRVRRTIHTSLLLAAAVVTVWLSAEGDWKKGLLALATVFYTASNRSNTPANETSGDQP